MTYLMVLTRCSFVFILFSDILSKSICCGYSFELHRQVDAIQMGTHNICLYKEVDKMYTGCNLKTTELLDCALIGVCAVIRSNTVHQEKFWINHKKTRHKLVQLSIGLIRQPN